MTSKLLAYYDTFAGLVPCRVVDVIENVVLIEITADRRGYKRGDTIQATARYVWPRDTSFRKRGSYGQTWIVPPFNWQERLSA